ncbi:MAG: hypothetical protein AAB834_03175 [Patescibacteria group bacterium]
MSTSISKNELSGIWRSRYEYPSSSRNGVFFAEHYVRVMRVGSAFVVESIPEVNDSYLILRLSLDDSIATGSWQECTSPTGYYKGAIYHGAIQLVIDKDHKRMKGKWVGFNKRMEIKTGSWEFTYLGDDMSVIHDRAKGQ